LFLNALSTISARVEWFGVQANLAELNLQDTELAEEGHLVEVRASASADASLLDGSDFAAWIGRR